MKVVITGGGGFLGKKLARRLLQHGGIAGPSGKPEPVSELVLFDVGKASGPGLDDPRVKALAGDIANFATVQSIVQGAATVFHFAAVVSAGAEADFDLGYRVNLDGTRHLLEACRKLARPPKVVFASSVAAFGGVLPEVLDDATTPAPQTSYGTQKVIGEYLVADFTRKGMIDGRSLRLPTIVVRPGKPNLAASSFASGIIREPLAGVAAECPVPDTTGVWILSPRRVVEAFLHARDLESAAWPTTRVVNLPGITLTVREMLDAMGRVAGRETVERVKFVPDSRIQGIVKTWPVRFRTDRALAMGFKADDGFEGIVRDHLESAR